MEKELRVVMIIIMELTMTILAKLNTWNIASTTTFNFKVPTLSLLTSTTDAKLRNTNTKVFSSKLEISSSSLAESQHAPGKIGTSQIALHSIMMFYSQALTTICPLLPTKVVDKI